MKKLKNLTLLFLIIIMIISNGCKKDKLLADSIKLNQKAVLLKINDSDTLNVSITPSGYDLKKVKWESSNSNIAIVNNSGIVTALNPGETSIIAYLNDERISDTCYVSIVNIVNYTISDGLLSNSVGSIAVDSTGNIWFGTYKGASKFDGINWTSYTETNGLASNEINCIAVDKQNNIWFGTQDGVSKFNGNSWMSYTISNGLANNRVDAIAFDNNGNTWFGTYNGLSKFDGENWITYNTSNGISGYENWVFGIVVDKISNNIWAITWDAVSVYDGVSWTGYFNDPNIGLYTTIYGISIDRSNNKWLSTIDGIFKFDGVKWAKQFTDSEYYLSFAHNIIFGKQDNIWFTTRDGIYKYDGANISTFKNENYNTINKTEINNINIDSKENIWIAKTFEGVYKLETK